MTACARAIERRCLLQTRSVEAACGLRSSRYRFDPVGVQRRASGETHPSRRADGAIRRPHGHGARCVQAGLDDLVFDWHAATVFQRHARHADRQRSGAGRRHLPGRGRSHWTGPLLGHRERLQSSPRVQAQRVDVHVGGYRDSRGGACDHRKEPVSAELPPQRDAGALRRSPRRALGLVRLPERRGRGYGAGVRRCRPASADGLQPVARPERSYVLDSIPEPNRGIEPACWSRSGGAHVTKWAAGIW